MLRIIFVSGLLIVGWLLALKGPLYGLVLYLWIAYFRPDQWVIMTDFFKTVPISFVAGLYLLVRSIFSDTKFRIDLRVTILFTILALAVASTFSSDYFSFSQLYLQDFAKSLIISYLISVIVSDPSKMRITILAITLSLSFEAAKQGWAQLVTNPGGANVNEIALLGDNNGVAVGMLMLVPLLVSLARTSPKRWERGLHQFLTVGVLYRAISTYSRGGFLSAGVLGLIFMARSPRRFRALLGAGLAGLLTLSVLPAEYWERMGTIQVEEGQERDASAASRPHFWRVAAIMAADQPLGIGVNAYTRAYDRYDFLNGFYGKGRSVHSAWFGMLAELGYVGLGLFVSAIALAWMAGRRARILAKKGLISQELGHFGTAVETALVVYSVGGSFVPFQYVELLWHTVGLGMAVHFITGKELAATKAVSAQVPRAPVIPPRPARKPIPAYGGYPIRRS